MPGIPFKILKRPSKFGLRVSITRLLVMYPSLVGTFPRNPTWGPEFYLMRKPVYLVWARFREIYTHRASYVQNGFPLTVSGYDV